MVHRLFLTVLSALSALVISLSGCSEPSDDLYLVIGSSRTEALDLANTNEITSKLHYSNDIDLTHRSTFGGRATTIDLLHSAIPNLSHIVGDASNYDFSSYSIKAVFIERIPTFIESGEIIEDSNLLGKIIENVAAHMSSGAILEIELDPYVNFYLEDISPDELNDTVRKNPFNGWHNFHVAYFSLMLSSSKVILGKSLESEISKLPVRTETRKAIFEATVQIKQWVKKTSIETKVSTEEIHTRLAQEMSIYKELLNRSSRDVAKYVALRFAANSTNEDFSFSYHYRSYLERPNSDGQIGSPNFILYEYPESSGLENSNHRLLDRHQFFQKTFANRLLGILSVERNKRFIVQELESRGFRDVTFEFAGNKYNGRRNTWMIGAIKI